MAEQQPGPAGPNGSPDRLDPDQRWVFEPMTAHDVYAHAIDRVLVDRVTPYQHLRIVESRSYGRALVLDGQWQSSLGDEFIYHESIVHAPAVLHGLPRSVLVLGGAEGATAREALRWPTVERVVTCDIDQDVVDACREFMPEMAGGAFSDPRHELIVGDAFEYVDRAAGAGERFDLIVSDLSDPIETGPSWRLFTRETFARCKRALSSGGAFIIQAGGLTPAEVRLHAAVNRTAAAEFEHASSLQVPVPIFGTALGMVIASDRPIDRQPDPSATDALLQEAGVRGLRFIDGRTLLGLYQVPLFVREATREGTDVFTLEHPPRFGGAED